jgi:subtilisin family serine protease
MYSKNLIFLTTLILIFLTSSAIVGADIDFNKMVRPGHVLIMTEAGFTPTIQSLLPEVPFTALKAYQDWRIQPLSDYFPARSRGGKSGLSALLDNLYLVSFPDTTDVRQVVARLRTDDNIRFAEPDYRVQLYSWPTDSLFDQQWYFHNTGQGFYAIERNDGPNNDVLYTRYGKPGEDVNLAPLFDNPPADSVPVLVGIIDTGIDYLHPDLADNVYVNPREIAGNGIDDDHNGLVDDFRGWDFSGDTLTLTVVGDNDVTDSIGHGTHVAGLVAAVQNEIGISGYPGRISILPVKIFPNGYLSVSIAAVLYAVEMGAKVLNLSWGFPYDSDILRETLHYAVDRGCIPVAAAGNFGNSMPTYPASFPETFTVGGTNADGYMTFFSTYGPFLDIVAPGRDILSLRAAGTDMYAPDEPGVRIIADKYYLADGTSMSAPIVSGAAAMLWSFHPGLTAQQIRDALCQSADDLVDPWGDGQYLPGYDTLSGWGRLNVGRAFEMLEAPALYIASPKENDIVSGDVVIQLKRTGGYGGPVDVYIGEGNIPSSWTSIYHADSITDSATEVIWPDQGLAGYYSIRVVASTGEDRVAVRVVNGSVMAIESPGEGEEIKYLAAIYCTAYDPAYDSTVVSYRIDGGGVYTRLYKGTSLYFNEKIYEWPLFNLAEGTYTLKLTLYAGATELADSVNVLVRSAMRPGFPIQLPGFAAISPGVCDINGDGFKEIVIGCTHGLYAFSHDGTLLDGFPVLTDKDMRSMPAFGDVDGDGLDDIIAVGQNTVGCFNYLGQPLDGWPKTASTGMTFSSHPIPVPTELYDNADSVFIYFTKYGEVHAYKYNGDPYFYSLGGLFTALDPNIFDTSLFAGLTLPMVTAADLNNDGVTEIIGMYSTSMPLSGIYLWNGRNGLPAFDWTTPLARRVRQMHGGMLADVDDDGTLEVVASVLDTNQTFTLIVAKNGNEDLPGWPVHMEGLSDWIGTAPVCADIDNDGSKEIVVAYFGYDVARIYAFNNDGTPYIENPSVPYGMLLSTPTTLSNIVVADIDGNGMPNLISRGGYIFPGTGYERVFAWEPNGDLTPGFPIVTPTQQVASTPFTPVIDDLDGDNRLEMIMAGDDGGLFVWDLDAPYDTTLMPWPKLFGDKKNSAVNRRMRNPTDATDSPQPVPDRFGIIGNHPNPFNPATTIEFSLERAREVRLEVFNVLGQHVKTVASGRYTPGRHTVIWDGTDESGHAVASGVYLSRLTGDRQHATHKMILLR